jgi:hypothetical protein
VLPDFGTRVELAHRGDDVVGGSWLIDVADLPRMGPPTTVPWRQPVRARASERHLLYLMPPNALICSEPVEVQVYPAQVATRYEGLSLEALSRIRWRLDDSYPDEFSARRARRAFVRAPIAAILTPE